MKRILTKAVVRVAVALAAATGGVAHAQSLDLMGGDGNMPITIDAKGGVEWNQKDQVFVASGPAKATRGEMVIDADEMRAYYGSPPGGAGGAPGAGGSNRVYRLDAIGTVRITAPGRVATGGHAIYDVDKAVVILKDGQPVTLTSGADQVTTTGQLEFWNQRNLAVARGDAQAVHADKRIRADVLTAHFAPNAAGKNEIERIEAFDHVVITTALDQVFADRAAYNVPTGLARLTGSVKIKRGDTVINGCSADIDLNTGISRLNSCEGDSVSGTTGAPTGSLPPKPSGKRVHGVLAPTDKK